jgi:hypothetical protein
MNVREVIYDLKMLIDKTPPDYKMIVQQDNSLMRI